VRRARPSTQSRTGGHPTRGMRRSPDVWGQRLDLPMGKGVALSASGGSTLMGAMTLRANSHQPTAAWLSWLRSIQDLLALNLLRT
jgi:hypothetical protein